MNDTVEVTAQRSARRSCFARRAVVGTLVGVGTTVAGVGTTFAAPGPTTPPEQVALDAVEGQVDTAKSFLSGVTPILFGLMGLVLVLGLGIKYGRRVKNLA